VPSHRFTDITVNGVPAAVEGAPMRPRRDAGDQGERHHSGQPGRPVPPAHDRDRHGQERAQRDIRGKGDYLDQQDAAVEVQQADERRHREQSGQGPRHDRRHTGRRSGVRTPIH
jgi:hypothetical protein